jgi:tetraacyldisaccharide 4'-kinase
MKAPAFWARPPGLVARLLQPLGWLYGRITALRMARPGVSCGMPVICIGNLTVGGAGKTPTARWISVWAATHGLGPAVLSLGYGGRLQGPVMVDPAVHAAADCGDEPLLLARNAPVVVARDRVAGAKLALAQGARLLIMDDGLQNPSLAKDLRLAVVDAGAGVGNGLVFPAGPLRASLDRQWAHVDAVLLIGAGAAGEVMARQALAAGKPVLRAGLVPEREAVAALRGKPLLAFAGIGRPEKFFETLRAEGLDLRETRPFGDHHAYTPADVAALEGAAAARGLVLVTTEKDAVRYPGDVAMLPVSLALSSADEAALTALISARIPSRP